jgi:hypothetical protein
VVANGEKVLVPARELADDAVLHRIQILELVDEDDVPARANRVRLGRALEQLGSLQHEHVEVHHLLLLEESLIALEKSKVFMLEWRPSKAVGAKPREQGAMPGPNALEATQHVKLIFLVGDAESRRESHARPVLPEQLGAERVDRARLHGHAISA